MTNRDVAIEIVRTLRAKGFEALLAGGCVRDMLLGRRPKDYDVATDATPKQVQKLFRRTLMVGAKFGVCMVMKGRQQVEVATFRRDADYDDGRHPRDVEFTSAKEDAKRRDFTINGMFYDPIKREVIDYVEGQADLERELIRTIGNAGERFAEDYLRMLRAVRFSAKLGFAVEQKTLDAICKYAPNITKISGERIAIELEQAFTCEGRVSAVRMLMETGLAKRLFANVSKEELEFGCCVLEQVQGRVSFGLALACVFAACHVEQAVQATKPLKMSRQMNSHLGFLLKHRGRLLERDIPLADLRMLAAEKHFEDLYAFQKALQKVHGESCGALTSFRRRLNALGRTKLLPKPFLNGHELQKMGLPKGPAMGKLLKQLYRAQLEGEVTNRRQAMSWIRSRMGK